MSLIVPTRQVDEIRHARRQEDRFLARARPPLRPAAFFCAVVPPCLARVERVRAFFLVPDAFPPRSDAPGEFEMAAARDFDIPFFFSASYCFRFSMCPRAMVPPA